jgi:hypothetical protein
MASTKSTVVGIRLDHERRAWVEAEAARLGVSVRGLFEGMIDEARSGGTAGAVRSGDGPETAVAPPAADTPEDDTAPAAGSEGEGTAVPPGGVTADRVNTAASASRRPTCGLPGLGSIAAFPVGLLRGACSITAGVIESTGRCATKRLGGCVLTRGRADRSV